MKKFPLKDKVFEFELGYGYYHILFTGGWYIKNLDELDICLIDKSTSESILLKNKSFFGYREQDYVGNQFATVAYGFYIQKYSNLELSISNPEDLMIKKNPPSLFLHNLIFGRERIPLENINIVIK